MSSITILFPTSIAAILGILLVTLLPKASPVPLKRTVLARARLDQLQDGPTKWVSNAVIAITPFLSHLIPEKIIDVLDRRVERAGCPMGLNAAEQVIMITISTGALCVSAVLVATYLQFPFLPTLLVGLALGVLWPISNLDHQLHTRTKRICRNLPAAVELVSLCLCAGLDFAGALTKVADSLKTDNPLQFEFRFIAHQLSLGKSKIESLSNLARRVPMLEMERFVAAVTQAEQKGTPLADTLRIQARVMRTQRTQAAEQAAARAAILMLGPMMLIFVSVFVLLLGPFIIKAVHGNLM